MISKWVKGEKWLLNMTYVCPFCSKEALYEKPWYEEGIRYSNPIESKYCPHCGEQLLFEVD